jgi:hypothetical protein
MNKDKNGWRKLKEETKKPGKAFPFVLIADRKM